MQEMNDTDFIRWSERAHVPSHLDTLSGNTVPLLLRGKFLPVSDMFRNCIATAQVMFRNSSETGLQLFRDHTGCYSRHAFEHETGGHYNTECDVNGRIHFLF